MAYIRTDATPSEGATRGIVALQVACVNRVYKQLTLQSALESGAFVVKATAWIDADQQAQIMADTGCPIGPISGGFFTAIITPQGEYLGQPLRSGEGQDDNGGVLAADATGVVLREALVANGARELELLCSYNSRAITKIERTSSVPCAVPSIAAASKVTSSARLSNHAG